MFGHEFLRTISPSETIEFCKVCSPIFLISYFLFSLELLASATITTTIKMTMIATIIMIVIIVILKIIEYCIKSNKKYDEIKKRTKIMMGFIFT